MTPLASQCFIWDGFGRCREETDVRGTNTQSTLKGWQPGKRQGAVLTGAASTILAHRKDHLACSDSARHRHCWSQEHMLSLGSLLGGFGRAGFAEGAAGRGEDGLGCSSRKCCNICGSLFRFFFFLRFAGHVPHTPRSCSAPQMMSTADLWHVCCRCSAHTCSRTRALACSFQSSVVSIPYPFIYPSIPSSQPTLPRVFLQPGC